MHILMLPSWYPQDAEAANGSFFREQAEALVRAGHRVGVIAVEGVSVTERRARSAATFTVAPERDEGGVSVVRARALRPVPLASGLNLSVLVRRWGRLVTDYIERHGRPDVLHAHATNPAGVAAAAASRATGIPYLITEHRPESALAEAGSGAFARRLARSVGDASALVAVSPAFADSLNEAYGTSRWRYLPNLLPAQVEHSAISVPEEPPFVFGHVSNLHPYKRVDLLIEAFADAFGGAPDVRLRIAGDSAYLAGHRALVESLGLDTVDFVGAVPRSDISGEFSRCHAFALASSAESFGVVLWEAMACGLPIVATATDGGRHAVSDMSGLLVPIDDRAALASKLGEMRRSAGRFDRVAIRRRTLDECGFEAFVGQYTELYAEVAEGAR